MDPLVESALISTAATLVGVGGTVVVAIVGFRSSRSTNKTTIEAAHADVQRTVDTTREGQIADIYCRAVEQLGSAKLEVRIGGTYGLERVARDSPVDHPTVMEVLTAFIREHSREHGPSEPARLPRPDIQAAITVIWRRSAERDIEPLNLADAYLARTDLHGANFNNANLAGANLTRAHLGGAHLGGAYLASAELVDADLGEADLTRANLTHANLTGAGLGSADLTGADLTGARWPDSVPVPEGWKRDPSSGGLIAADTGAETSEAN